MVCYRTTKFVTRLHYEYAQGTVDLFCENVTPVHCLVAVYIRVLPFFLYLKECVVISEFGLQSCADWQGRQDLQSKTQCLMCTLIELHEMCPPLMVAATPDKHLAVKVKMQIKK